MRVSFGQAGCDWGRLEAGILTLARALRGVLARLLESQCFSIRCSLAILATARKFAGKIPCCREFPRLKTLSGAPRRARRQVAGSVMAMPGFPFRAGHGV